MQSVVGLTKAFTSSTASKQFIAHHSIKTSTWRRSAFIIHRCYSTTERRGPSVCVVGSGPAGFYTADRILSKNPNVRVDMLEHWPVPAGLVRYGVAPDHPEVKNAGQKLDLLASQPNFAFRGNVALGRDISLDQLRQWYDAVVIACGGSSKDRKLNIPGEDEHVMSAREFVGWYNGLPTCQHLKPKLGKDVLIIGHGNVSLDVARLILNHWSKLKRTDITQNALALLAEGTVRSVRIIGRRGPLQVSFTAKELRDLTKIQWATNSPSVHAESIMTSEREKFHDFIETNRGVRRLMNVFDREPQENPSKHWGIEFLQSPMSVESIVTPQGTTRLKAKFEMNELVAPTDHEGFQHPIKYKARGTGQYVEYEVDSILRSIGYEAVPLPGLPFDDRLKVVPNTEGRVTDMNGVYVSGWIMRGATGLIVNTMADSHLVADLLLKDLDSKPSSKSGREALDDHLKSRGTRFITFDEYKKIDAYERAQGQILDGKSREKITSVEKMIQVAYSGRVDV